MKLELDDVERYNLFEDVIAMLRFESLRRSEQHAQLERVVAAERERLAAACWERRGHFASDAAARAFAELVRNGRA